MTYRPSSFLALLTSSSAASASAAVCALLALAPPAFANGRYPAAGQIVVDPSDPAHIVVRATYGILSTSDSGGAWGWICEEAVGYSGVEDPMMGITKTGALLAGVFSGLSVSPDRGCTWGFKGGGLTEKFVTDLSVEKADPSRAVLVVSNGVSSNTFLTQLWESIDSGDTWTQAGVDLPSDFLALNVDVAPSDPQRIYVSGRYGGPLYPGAIARSSDRGKTWEMLPVPGADDTHLAYLSAVDPTNPDLIYLRLDGEPVDSLLVSKDGGGSWQPDVFQSTGNLYGFALSPDGATVYVGGGKDGLWRAPASTLKFQKVSQILVRCLTATSAGLYACADEFADGFTAGLSIDQGSTFSPIMHLASPCGPLECPGGTTVASKCAGVWGVTQLTIGADACGAGGGSASTGAGAPPPPAADDDGCGCRAAPSSRVGVGAALGVVAFALARARRAGSA